jgi:hypothetical protein
MLSNSDRSKLADCPNRIHRGARLRLGGSVPSHFSYTPCGHELVQRGVRTLGHRGFGRARCIWRCVTRPTPPSRRPERHLFASTSSAINFRNAWRASQVDKGRLRSARSASAASSIWLTPLRLLGDVQGSVGTTRSGARYRSNGAASMTAPDRCYSAPAFMDNTSWSTPNGSWWSPRCRPRSCRSTLRA